MITLFVLEGFWLWAVLGVSFLLLGTFTYRERYSAATGDVVALLVLLAFTGNLNSTWEYVRHNPLPSLGILVGYLVLGVVWARLKWSFLIRRLKKLVDAHKQAVLKSSEARDNYSLVGTGVIYHNNDGGRYEIQMDRFKSKIIGWIAYWPMSLLLWLVGDFIHDLFDTLYRAIKGHFQRAADNTFNG